MVCDWFIFIFKLFNISSIKKIAFPDIDVFVLTFFKDLLKNK